MLWRQCRWRPPRLWQSQSGFRGLSSHGSKSGKPAAGLRILFFGNDSFSLETLSTLHREWQAAVSGGGGAISHLEVCCSPPAPSGGPNRQPGPVRRFSGQSGLALHHHPVSSSALSEGRFDLGVVASFGHLIPKRVIQAFPRGILNVHGSLLPRWRGASPIPHAILHGDKETGVSIMEVMPHHFDVGCVLATRKVPIPDDAFREELSATMARAGAELMLEVLRDLDGFQERKRTQGEEGVTYAPILDRRRLLRLPWPELTSLEAWRLFRAVGDLGSFRAGRWAPTGEEVRLGGMRNPAELDDDALDRKALEEGGASFPGRVLVSRSGERGRTRLLCVRCRRGWSAFDSVRCGGKRMAPLDFYNGFVSKLDARSGERAMGSVLLWKEEEGEDLAKTAGPRRTLDRRKQKGER